MLKFEALQAAPYIYDISRLRVNMGAGVKNNMHREFTDIHALYEIYTSLL
jgi:hypothetical protein